MTAEYQRRLAAARQARESLYERVLDDGRVVFVVRMAFAWRVCIGEADDETGYEDGWCYPERDAALAACEQWDGDGDPPDGWVKHLNSGRRR